MKQAAQRSYRIFIVVITSLGTILSICSVLGVLPVVLPFLYVNGVLSVPTYLQYIIAAFCLVYLLAVVRMVLGERTTHILKMESKPYYRFFRKWYSNHGTITMYCENLSWIEDDPQLLKTLEEKCNKGLTLYLCDRSSPAADSLEARGAQIHLLPNGNLREFSFSTRNYNNSESFMIRYNDEDDHQNNTITVHEIYKDASRTVLKKYREELQRKVVASDHDPVSH